MDTSYELQLSHFQKSLNLWRLLAFRFLPVLLLVCLTLFLWNILFLLTLDNAEETPAESDSSFIMMLSLVSLLLNSVFYFLSFLLRRFLSFAYPTIYFWLFPPLFLICVSS